MCGGFAPGLLDRMAPWCEGDDMARRRRPLEDLRPETRLTYQLSQCTIWSSGMRSAGLNSSPVKYPTVINAACV